MSCSILLPATDVDQAPAAAFGTRDVVLLGVRANQTSIAGHAPTARPLPMRVLPARLDELPRHARPVCSCPSSNRSRQGTIRLRSQGDDAVNVNGGMQRWAGHGHPVIDDTGQPSRVI